MQVQDQLCVPYNRSDAIKTYLAFRPIGLMLTIPFLYSMNVPLLLIKIRRFQNSNKTIGFTV